MKRKLVLNMSTSPCFIAQITETTTIDLLLIQVGAEHPRMPLVPNFVPAQEVVEVFHDGVADVSLGLEST
jgi:hypothetical protein